MSAAFSYSIAVFVIVLIAGCAVNLLKEHYIFQLLGIAFFFTYIIINSAISIESSVDVSFRDLFYSSLPLLFGISSCLISMTLGFWLFPAIRDKIKE